LTQTLGNFIVIIKKERKKYKKVGVEEIIPVNVCIAEKLLKKIINKHHHYLLT
jgi:hypothetical protein